MNELQKLNNDETIRISSREIAGMLTMEHSKVIRKIEGITKDLTDAKIGLSDLWVQSVYKDVSGKSNKEYLLSKQGCEFFST